MVLEVARRCKVCSHPSRAAIDGDLVRGISYRTVSGRYGTSVGTLHNHRTWHVLEPTLGDILEPDGLGQGWQQWDGERWVAIPEQDRATLKEVSNGRPDHMHRRSQNVMIDPSNPRAGVGVLVRRVYRLRRTPKPLTAEVSVDRQGNLLVTNRDRCTWFSIRLVLNGRYRYRRYLKRLPAGFRFRIPMSDFVNDQGSPFDWRSTEPRREGLPARRRDVAFGECPRAGYLILVGSRHAASTRGWHSGSRGPRSPSLHTPRHLQFFARLQL